MIIISLFPDFSNKMSNVYNLETMQFMSCFKSKWDEIHNGNKVFRYKINKLQEKVINGKYVLQLNPDRSTNRRTPAQIEYICQPFDMNKFNFTKISHEEVMFNLCRTNEDCMHAVIVNVSPISHYHSLLCPSLDKGLPQVMTKDSLKLAINIMFMAKDRDLRIGFNSLCALASVNHLHYHLCIEKHDLPVENIVCTLLKGNLYCLDKAYPVPAFCFEVPSPSEQVAEDIFKLLEHLLQNSIAHNVFITRGRPMCGSDRQELIRVIIWPRKSSSGVKKFDAFNVAVFELSGWFPVYNADDFNNLCQEDLEDELKKWKIDDFDDLCEEVKLLY